MAFIGIIIGVLIILVMYLLTMITYVHYRKKYADKKFMVEAITILIVIAASIGVKVAILIVVNGAENLFEGFATFWYAVFTGIGGLTFDDSGIYGEIPNVCLKCLYTGTTLWSGLTFLSVVANKVSYEIYCFQLLVVGKITDKLFRKNKNIDFYIFTSVTEDSLTMAKSIDEHEKLKKKIGKYRIIFAGAEIDAFDGKNPLHMELMKNGYLYWSYPNVEKTYKNGETSIIRKLGLFSYVKNAKSGNHIYIFSLGINEDLSGHESVNSDIVFDEISNLTSKYQLLSKKNPVKNRVAIDFYVLTDNEINYEFYQSTVESRIIESLKQIMNSEEIKESLIEEYKTRFVIHIINEAVVTSKCLTKRRIEEYGKDDENLFINDATPYEDNTYRTLALGFGQNGQHAINEVFINTSYVNSEGRPSQFVVDVYDPKIDEKVGLFMSSFPFFACTNYHECNDNETINKKISSLDDDLFIKQKEYFSDDVLSKTYKKENNKPLFDNVKENLGFPIVVFHDESCFSATFDEFLRDDCVFNKGSNNITSYNSIVVALGNDEYNISMGNLLIDQLKKEYLIKKTQVNQKVQNIYINIRDEKNLNRINWHQSDMDDIPYLKVIKFGTSSEIYSYEQIIDDSKDKLCDKGYRLICESIKLENGNSKGIINEKLKNIFEKFNNGIIKEISERENEDIDFTENIITISDNIKSILDSGELDDFFEDKWLNLSIFKRESNSSASRFSPFYTKTLKEDDKITPKELMHYFKIEHIRWCRFFMSNGWVFAENNYEDLKLTRAENRKRMDMRRYHKDLCPTEMLSKDSWQYDIINVLLAYEILDNYD